VSFHFGFWGNVPGNAVSWSKDTLGRLPRKDILGVIVPKIYCSWATDRNALSFSIVRFQEVGL